jgi:hypothetical protein
LESIEKEIVSGGNNFMWGCGYYDTSTSSDTSSSMRALFARYSMNSEDKPQSSSTKMFYYSSENQDSRCLAITISGYGLVLGTSLSTSVAMESHLIKIDWSSTTNLVVYKFDTQNFKQQDNKLYHGRFT